MCSNRCYSPDRRRSCLSSPTKFLLLLSSRKCPPMRIYPLGLRLPLTPHRQLLRLHPELCHRRQKVLQRALRGQTVSHKGCCTSQCTTGSQISLDSSGSPRE